MHRALPFEERIGHCQNPASRRLCEIMARKQTNVMLAADVTSSAELLALAKQCGPYLCALKTHIDIVDDFSPELVDQLRLVAQEQDFLLFEDRKFADIGKTVQYQYTQGVYRIASWADLITVHSVPGPGIIDGLREACLQNNAGMLMLAEMSSKGTLTDEAYAQATLVMAEANKDVVAGFITQRKLLESHGILHFAPGVKLAAGGDGLGQQYNTPSLIITERGCDGIIVGRGITQAEDPGAVTKTYAQAGWEAYQARLDG